MLHSCFHAFNFFTDSLYGREPFYREAEAAFGLLMDNFKPSSVGCLLAYVELGR